MSSEHGLVCSFGFGIGNRFQVVPGPVASAHMPIINAVATLPVVGRTVGLAKASNPVLSGLVDRLVATAFIGGGVLGAAADAEAGALREQG